MKKLISAIIAGSYIGIGATVYLLTHNQVAGAFFFCVGIFLVMNYYNMLFTKVVPLSVYKQYSVKDIVITFVGNFIGEIIYAFLISQTRLAEKIHEKLIGIMEIKLADDLLSLFIMAIFCAVLVAYATFGEKVYPDNKILSVAFTFLFIMAFVICGFDHIVANMFYYSFYCINDGFKQEMIPTFIVVLLGNIVGGLGIGFLELYRTKKCQEITK